MLTEAALTRLKNLFAQSVSYVRYKIGSLYYRTEISNSYLTADGKVAVEFSIDPAAQGAVTISEIRIYSVLGDLLLITGENITRKTSREAVFYRVLLEVSEV